MMMLGRTQPPVYYLLLFITLLLFCWHLPVVDCTETEKAVSIEEAVELARKWLSQGPEPPHASSQFHQQARHALEQVLQLNPQHGPANFLLGTYHHLQSDYISAVQHYDASLRSNPTSFEAHANKGRALADLGRHHDAITHLQQALQVDPTNRIALLTLGSSFHASGQQEQAVRVYRQMIELGYGEDAQVQFGVGLAFQHLGQIVDAAHHYFHALELHPNFIEAALNLAALHHRYGRVEDSIDHYQRAAEILMKTQSKDMDLISMVHNNLGLAFMQLGRAPSALREHDYVLQVLQDKMGQAPSDSKLALHDAMMVTRSHAFRGRKSVCDWEGWEIRLDDLLRDMDVRLLMHRLIDTLLPFDTLGLPVEQEWRKLIAQAYSVMWDQMAATSLPPPDPPPPSPSLQGHHPGLHVGYLCYDFNDHPTAQMVEGLFYHHRYPVSAYSYGKDDNSSYRRNIESLTGSGFVDLVSLGHHEAVAAVRHTGAHIVVDLQGYTLGTRSELTALRLAPIQVSYLIYPGTSGSSTTDYLIADPYVLPPEQASRGYTERIVYLPSTYQVNYYGRHLGPSQEAQTLRGNDSPLVGWREALRTANHLPPSSQTMVFCNFNKNDKLEPQMFHVWMGILRRVPDSILWLLQPSRGEATALTISNLRREAEARGVSGDRLVFAGRVDKAHHLVRHAAGDLFLDTFFYGAHSTATDALRGGLPVLTLPGDAFPSRVGASLLHNMDSTSIPLGLTMTSMKAYEDMAVDLASSSEGRHVLDTLTEEVRRQAGMATLFDTPRLTRDMERSFEVMWEAQRAGGDHDGEGDRDKRGNQRPLRYHLVVGNQVS